MNNPFFISLDIISGTESAYVFNEPLPVLNLYDRLKSNHKLALNKNIDNWSSALTIKNKLKNTINYEDLSVCEIKLLYSMINLWWHDCSNQDIMFGNNLFEK